MSFDYVRNQTNTIQLTVLGLTGKPLNFPADYDTPRLRISHVNGAGEIEDLPFTNMVQLASSNRWYYKYTVPAGASYTKYLVTFESTIEGITTQATEEYRVVQEVAGAGGALPGAGEFAITSEVRHGVSNQPLNNVTIRVFDKSVPTIAIATVQTDSSGEFTVFLDEGLYLIEFSKTGVISEVHDLVVYANGTFDIRGN